MTTRDCDSCGNETSSKELGRRVRGEYLCKKCRVENRETRREKTIDDAGIRDELKELDSKNRKEKGYSRKAYEKKIGRPVRKYKDYGNEGAPIPKGSKILTRKRKTECYLTFHERQDLFRMLLSRGMDSEDVKERIQGLTDSQERLREELSEKDKTEEEIKEMQKELLQELYTE